MKLLSSSNAMQARRHGAALHAEPTTAGMFAIELLMPRPGAPES